MRRSRGSNLPSLALLAALAALALAVLGRPSRPLAPARRALPPGPGPAAPFVRPAGPEAMRDPPREWDVVDEISDASFPASDPPARY